MKQAFTIKLTGRIDSGNSAETKDYIEKEIAGHGGVAPVLDLSELKYVSSAGLRVFLSLAKAHKKIRFIEVNDEIYRIFEMTGFDNILDITRAFRFYDSAAAKKIAGGSEGDIFRVDQDTIVKVYKGANDPGAVQERIDFAHRVFQLGVPSAIPYDVVRFGDTYGAVYEMIDSHTLSKLLSKNPDNYRRYMDLYLGVMKELHGISDEEGEFPLAKDVYNEHLTKARPLLGEDLYSKLKKLIDETTGDETVIHGDLHLNNIMMQGDEALLIDLDTVCRGNVIFEFGGIHYSYQSFDKENNAAFHKLTVEDMDRIWRDLCIGYFENEDETFLKSIEDKAAILSSIHQVGNIEKRGKHVDFENINDAAEHYLNIIKKSLENIDSLGI